MVVAEKIHQYVLKLPEKLQGEVLHFVEFLLSKSDQEELSQTEDDWSDVSISMAMKGMAEEEGNEYSMSDLKERFK